MENSDATFVSVDAVYRRGVFQPLEPVQLAEEQRVRLNIQAAGSEAAQTWLARVKKLQEVIVRRGGEFPDSAPEIAADRLR
jgi:predicted DNA-binding antitoxin AbrB/MazE fold protein